MKTAILLLFLALPASAQIVRENGGGSVNGQAITPTSVSANSLSAVYGVSAATAVITYVQASSANIGGVPLTASGNCLGVFGSTTTVCSTGFVSAPSQPGARADTLAMVTTAIQRAVFFQLYWTNSSTNGSYNRNNSFKYDGASSDSFKARGAGIYYVHARLGVIQNTGTNASMTVYAMVNGTVRSQKLSVPTAASNWSADLTDFLSLADGDVVTFKVYSDDASNNPTPVNSGSEYNIAIVQKVW